MKKAPIAFAIFKNLISKYNCDAIVIIPIIANKFLANKSFPCFSGDQNSPKYEKNHTHVAIIDNIDTEYKLADSESSIILPITNIIPTAKKIPVKPIIFHMFLIGFRNTTVEYKLITNRAKITPNDTIIVVQPTGEQFVFAVKKLIKLNNSFLYNNSVTFL